MFWVCEGKRWWKLPSVVRLKKGFFLFCLFFFFFLVDWYLTRVLSLLLLDNFCLVKLHVWSSTVDICFKIVFFTFKKCLDLILIISKLFHKSSNGWKIMTLSKVNMQFNLFCISVYFGGQISTVWFLCIYCLLVGYYGLCAIILNAWWIGECLFQ